MLQFVAACCFCCRCMATAAEIQGLGAQMVKLNEVYNRTGDEARRALGTGNVCSRQTCVEAYGAVDEANAWVGLVKAASG